MDVRARVRAAAVTERSDVAAAARREKAEPAGHDDCFV